MKALNIGFCDDQFYAFIQNVDSDALKWVWPFKGVLWSPLFDKLLCV